jgi:hypothetical protein
MLLRSIGLLAAMASLPLATRGAPARAIVSVTVTCKSGQPTAISVAPGTLVINQGDFVYWQLTKNSDEVRFTIVPSTEKTWPFAENRFTGDRREVARSLGMFPNSAGRYHYTVTATCPRGGTSSLDPDIIIR